MHSKKLIVGNLKMHGRLKWNEDMLTALLTKIGKINNLDIALCLPFPYLWRAQSILSGTNIAWGSQNVSQYEDGAFTGSISSYMVAEFGCRYATIGHSKRRALSSENFQSAANRFTQALKANLTPIFCVGEKEGEREKGNAKAVVESQVRALLGSLDPQMLELMFKNKAVFAYEPAWAIGTENFAKPKAANEMHEMIRKIIAEKNSEYAKQVKIIYGGSMTPDNAEALLTMDNIDGGLVGRCSIDPSAFSQICETANQLKCGETS